MKETMTISQLIAETKRIDVVMLSLRNNMDLVVFYRKDNPFIKGRTIEEHEAKMKADLQSYIDNQTRLFAIKSALSKANRETVLKVPMQPSLADVISGKYDENKTEEITIAEAINRKLFYKNILVKEADSLLNHFNKDLQAKQRLDFEVENYVNNILSKKFPQDAKQAWSVDKFNEEKKKELNNAEVIRIDPCNIVGSEAITKYANAIGKYLSTIDTLLSQINASTIVEVEY